MTKSWIVFSSAHFDLGKRKKSEGWPAHCTSCDAATATAAATGTSSDLNTAEEINPSL